MAAKRTLLLLLAVTTAAFSATTTEPKLATPKPSFEMNDVPLGMSRSHGDVRPKYMAKVVLLQDRAFSAIAAWRWIMDSAWAQKLSPAQRKFLEGPRGDGHQHGRGISSGGGPRDHVWIELYAVSEEDAKTMASAVLDAFTTQALSERTRYSRFLDGLKREAGQTEAELSEKEERLKEVNSQYDQRKVALYPFVSDDEAAQLARELVFQMEKEGKMLEIELAGIRAKLEIIDEYCSGSSSSKYKITSEKTERLEAMYIDLMIELSGLEARREAIERIRTAERQFYSLYSERKELNQVVPSLRSALKEKNQKIERTTAQLEEPSGEMVPPEVYEDKVVIYPIQSEGSQN